MWTQRRTTQNTVRAPTTITQHWVTECGPTRRAASVAGVPRGGGNSPGPPPPPTVYRWQHRGRRHRSCFNISSSAAAPVANSIMFWYRRTYTHTHIREFLFYTWQIHTHTHIKHKGVRPIYSRVQSFFILFHAPKKSPVYNTTSAVYINSYIWYIYIHIYVYMCIYEGINL